MKIKILFFAIVTALAALPFQNCTVSKFGDSGRPTKSQQANSGGQPYDGKPYVHAGQTCPDGSVEARIIYHNSNSAALVKDNCQPVNPPTALTAADFSLDTQDVLHFSGRDFVVEPALAKLTPMASFYPQMTGTLNTATPASVLAIDLFDNSQEQITQLKAAGKVVLCNLSAGSFEPWRSDASSFSASIIGNSAGPGGERYVDIRAASVRDIMSARLNMAKTKGCDGVDLDRTDSFENNSGFNLNAAAGISYIQFLSQTARALGLLVTVRSGTTIAASVVAYADGAIAQQCYQYNECDAYKDYIDAGKAVFITEYSAFSNNLCNQAKADGYTLVFVNPALDGTQYQACP